MKKWRSKDKSNIAYTDKKGNLYIFVTSYGTKKQSIFLTLPPQKRSPK